MTFTVQTIGTKPLRYQWQWTPAGGGSSSGEWQQCDAERFPGADSSTLTISSVQKSNEGSFRCAVSNCAGSQTSKPAKLSVGMNPCFIAFVWSMHHFIFYFVYAADPPKISSHPQDLNNAVPGKSVAFTIQATGTEPLCYQWQQNRAVEGTSCEEWQQCGAESFPDASSPKLIISSLQKLNEGSYRCVVSNCAGIQISKPAKLSVGKIPEVCSFGTKCKTYYAFYMQLIPLASRNIHKSYKELPQANLYHSLSEPLEQNLSLTDGSGNQLEKRLAAGSSVMQRGFKMHAAPN